MNWALAFQVAKFVIWLVLNIKEFVIDAEQRRPGSGEGSEKFAAVKEAVAVAAKIAGMADAAIDAVSKLGLIDTKINDAVASEINKV